MNRRQFFQKSLSGAAAIGLASCASTVKKRPNFLIALADDVSFPHMGAYGNTWTKTPAFDRVAAQGVLFTRAYTPNAKCAPSRSCLLTGRNSWQLEEACNHWCYYPRKYKTVFEALGENGYFTGFTAKGLAPVVLEEGHKPLGKRYSEIKLTPPAEHINSIDYAANFEAFLADREFDQPFCFWYGSTEPHRAYEYGAGARVAGKQNKDIDKVPAFWPDTEDVRTDMNDYAFETEYFDRHLDRMLRKLEELGELDNTVVIVTADNGMPFPRAKGQEYEYSNHLPFAMMWGAGIKNPGRVVDDFVSFIEVAPTMLSIAGVPAALSGMQPIEGKKLNDILKSGKAGMVDTKRDHVLIGKERHDVGRPGDVGYPIRGIVKGDYLYVKNYETERWPACNPETGYLNCDGSPTKTVVLESKKNPKTRQYWELSFGKRPEEELYNIKNDPECIENLATKVEHQDLRDSLREQMESELKVQNDPRMFGKGDVFDTYLYSNKADVDFYERFKRGEEVHAGWVNDSDFEK